MKKNFQIILILFLSTLFSCAKNSWIHPGSQAPEEINFTQHNLYPEGMTYDFFHNVFMVSSLTSGTVGGVSFDGSYNPFIQDPDLPSSCGIRIDRARQRIVVCNVGNGGVATYDINTGKRIFLTDLSALSPGEPVLVNDAAFDPQGNIYATNSFSPVIYKIDINGKGSVFFRNSAFDVPPGNFGLNGIQYNDGGFLLVGHTTQNKLLKLPLQNPSNYSEVQLNAALNMPDGLLLSKNGKQIVVVSGDVVLSFISNDQWKSGILSTSFTTGPDMTTSLTSDGKRVFVMYSPLYDYMGGLDHDNYKIKEVPLTKPDSF